MCESGQRGWPSGWPGDLLLQPGVGVYVLGGPGEATRPYPEAAVRRGCGLAGVWRKEDEGGEKENEGGI